MDKDKIEEVKSKTELFKKIIIKVNVLDNKKKTKSLFKEKLTKKMREL